MRIGKKKTALLWILALCMFFAANVSAAFEKDDSGLSRKFQLMPSQKDDPDLARKFQLMPPDKVLLFPDGGRLENVFNAIVQSHEGSSIVQFVVPSDAANLRIFTPNHTIARWSSAPVMLSPSSEHASARQRMLDQRSELSAKLLTVKARVSLWQAQLPQDSAQDLAQRQTMMQNALPALAQEQEKLEKQLRLVNEELARMPGNDGLGQQITVTLASSLPEGEKIKIVYSYDSHQCGWRAVYDFDAYPDEKGDLVNMRFVAEVWQYTGIDWNGAHVTLATRAGGPREPKPLPPWYVGVEKPKPEPKPAPKPQARAVMLKAQASSAENDLDSMPEPLASVTPDTDTMFATWRLGAQGLPEGKSHITIAANAWKTPLQWLARPTYGDNRVWIYAKYDLPADQAWPEGIAQYSVNGQSIGEGIFMPKGGEVSLYFGADPRVTIRTTIDSSKQGETGIINTNQTWTGAWTYTISNEHNKAVKVRVERPMPILGNDSMKVSYNDKPVSVKDEKEHMLYWLIETPAHGKAVIQHSVTITSPVKLPLFPDVP